MSNCRVTCKEEEKHWNTHTPSHVLNLIWVRNLNILFTRTATKSGTQNAKTPNDFHGLELSSRSSKFSRLTARLKRYMFVNDCVSQPNLFMLDFFFEFAKKREIKLFNRPPPPQYQRVRHPQGPPITRVEAGDRPTSRKLFLAHYNSFELAFFCYLTRFTSSPPPFDHQTMLQWRHSLNKIFHPHSDLLPRSPADCSDLRSVPRTALANCAAAWCIPGGVARCVQQLGTIRNNFAG